VIKNLGFYDFLSLNGAYLHMIFLNEIVKLSIRIDLLVPLLCNCIFKLGLKLEQFVQEVLTQLPDVDIFLRLVFIFIS
jgi:hypothetical protein